MIFTTVMCMLYLDSTNLHCISLHENRKLIHVDIFYIYFMMIIYIIYPFISSDIEIKTKSLYNDLNECYI